MSRQSFLFGIVSQLLFQLPTLIILTLGLVFSLMWWNRHPRVSLLTFLATLLALLSSVVLPVAQMYLINQRNRGGWNMAYLNHMLSGMAVVGGIIRGITYALLLAAVFSGRPRGPVSHGYPVLPADRQ